MSGIPSWARVGAKVVCVDATRTNPFNAPELIEGATYEISDVTFATVRCGNQYGNACYAVRLVGVQRLFRGSTPFAIGRFRPLISKTQEEDVALFTHLLEGKPVEERV